MCSRFKAVYIASAFLISAVTAAPIKDATAHKAGIQAGIATVDGLVLAARKNFAAAKELFDKIDSARNSYSDDNHNRDFHQGVLDGLKKRNMSAVFQKAGLNDKQKLFVLFLRNFVKTQVERKISKKSTEEVRQEAFANAMKELHQSIALAEQMKMFVGNLEQEMVAAFEELEPQE